MTKYVKVAVTTQYNIIRVVKPYRYKVNSLDICYIVRQTFSYYTISYISNLNCKQCSLKSCLKLWLVNLNLFPRVPVLLFSGNLSEIYLS